MAFLLLSPLESGVGLSHMIHDTEAECGTKRPSYRYFHLRIHPREVWSCLFDHVVSYPSFSLAHWYGPSVVFPSRGCPELVAAKARVSKPIGYLEYLAYL